MIFHKAIRRSFAHKLALIALCAVSSAWIVSAQESMNHASVSGRVTDETGAVIGGAQVIARHADTNLTSTLLTDHDGRFRFPLLKVGQYEIKVQRPGFAVATRSVTLTVGSAFELPVALVVASSETNITVDGETAMLETARTQIAGTVSQAEMRALPL